MGTNFQGDDPHWNWQLFEGYEEPAEVEAE
jgi:hypothetical protein